MLYKEESLKKKKKKPLGGYCSGRATLFNESWKINSQWNSAFDRTRRVSAHTQANSSTLIGPTRWDVCTAKLCIAQGSMHTQTSMHKHGFHLWFCQMIKTTAVLLQKFFWVFFFFGFFQWHCWSNLVTSHLKCTWPAGSAHTTHTHTHYHNSLASTSEVTYFLLPLISSSGCVW